MCVPLQIMWRPFLDAYIFPNSSGVRFLVRRDESPENFCHSPGVVVVVVIVVVVVHRQKH